MRTEPAGALAGLAAAAAAVACRGLRLTLLLPRGVLGAGRASAVAAVAQAAAIFVPARVGELALPLLLRSAAGRDLATGVGVLLVARAMDIAALGGWGVASLVAVRGGRHPILGAVAAALLLAPLALPMVLAATDRLAVRFLAPRARWRRWAHRVRRVRRATTATTADRPRFLGAAAASVAMWACLWTLAWLLLRAMGVRWPFPEVVAGSAAASLANLLPFNLTGNLGTLEAGWTAAFVALGRPLDVAAATGLASHLWALVFTALLGALGWLALGHRRPR
jgi:uncharacterized membrane protein YbhN (UPF0104 family)